MQEKLLTIGQVAGYLKIHRFTVYRFVMQKKIRAFKVGNQWRFKKKLLEDWLNKNSNQSSEESTQQ